jgi:hypothetical protein
VTTPSFGAGLDAAFLDDPMLLAHNRRAFIDGVLFDFNPPLWPAFDAEGEWRPQSSLGEWLRTAGLQFRCSDETYAVSSPCLYEGCRVYAFGALAHRPAPTSSLNDIEIASTIELSLRLQEPTGAETDLAAPYIFFRNPDYLTLTAINERVARATSPDQVNRRPLTAQAWWNDARAEGEGLQLATDAFLARITFMENGVERSELPANFPFSRAQFDLMDLVEIAIRYGYRVRAAEFAAYENAANSGVKVSQGGAKGGSDKKRLAKLAEKAAVWRQHAHPLIDGAIAGGAETVSEIMNFVFDHWYTSDNQSNYTAMPSESSLRNYINLLRANGVSQ